MKLNDKNVEELRKVFSKSDKMFDPAKVNDFKIVYNAKLF